MLLLLLLILDVWYRPDDACWVAVIAGYREEGCVVVNKILGQGVVIGDDGEEFVVKGFGGAVEYSFYGGVVYIEYFWIAFS